MAKLGDVCEILNGFAFRSEQYVDEGIRIIRISNVQKGYIEDSSPVFYPSDSEEAQKYRLEENDLLISLTGNVGRVAILSKAYLPAALNQRVACIRIKNENELYKPYLFHLLNSDFFESRCIKASKGVAQKNMSTQWLKDYEIGLPSIEEQRRIAAVLDKVTDLITQRRAQLDKLDLLVKSRFVEMFGDPVENPFSYPQKKLSEYVEFLTSGSRGWSQYFSNEGEYFITIKNVKNCAITLDNMQHIKAPDNAEALRTRVQEGDLLISITADLGRTGVVTKEIAEHGAYINQHLTCIRLAKEKVLPLYAAYYLESPVGKSQFAAKNQNGVKAGLNFNAINSLEIVVPPVEKQYEFISYVDAVNRLTVPVMNGLQKLETLKNSLMQEYFG